jgi:hypothetical protein
MGRQGLAGEAADSAPTAKVQAPPRRYDMKKSINLWAFPYPDQMSLKECFQLAKDAGFEGVEVNFNLEGELSAESSAGEIREIGELAQQVGIAISGLCSFLFWPYSLTHNDPERRAKGLELARQMIQAARLLGTDNLLVVPGADPFGDSQILLDKEFAIHDRNPPETSSVHQLALLIAVAEEAEVLSQGDAFLGGRQAVENGRRGACHQALPRPIRNRFGQRILGKPKDQNRGPRLYPVASRTAASNQYSS